MGFRRVPFRSIAVHADRRHLRRRGIRLRPFLAAARRKAEHRDAEQREGGRATGRNEETKLGHAGHLILNAAAGRSAENWQRLYRACRAPRSEEHTSELQSLMRISYAVFCLKKKKKKMQHTEQETKYLSTLTPIARSYKLITKNTQ